MKACGIIAEYNPFHNGHAYQLQKAREFGDIVVVVMSGDFVQRGEPALLDKHQRSEIAVRNGADLVVELPWFGAVQSADYFAKVAVDLLQDLSVDTLCFGTEVDERFDYMAFVQRESENKEALRNAFQKVNQKFPNKPYPWRVAKVYQDVLGETALEQPNHLLGLTYARANIQGKRPMQLQPILRQGAGHYDGQNGQFASGTAIRQAVLTGDDQLIQSVVPRETAEAVKGICHDWEDYYPYLRYQLIAQSPEALRSIYQMTEGLEQRIRVEAETMEAWLDCVTTKRYTKARMQRLAFYTLAQITHTTMKQAWGYPYHRVLASNKQGRRYLAQITPDYPVISNIRQQQPKALDMEQRLENLYHLPENTQFSFAKSYRPIIIKENY